MDKKLIFDKEIDEIVELANVESSLAYLCGIKYAQSIENGHWTILPDEKKYECLKISNPKYNIPLKELKRISKYM